METIGNLIENYENQAYEIKEASPVDTLKYLNERTWLKTI